MSQILEVNIESGNASLRRINNNVLKFHQK